MPRYSNKTSPKEDGFKEFDKHFIFKKGLGAGGFGKVVLAIDRKTN